ncbi:hypothetical protein GCM10012275_36240 [Longimycelium tulufanense]|uniref:Uncharacterized protein n=1 Tax=Longimycelium tulufanense TaxID=907463 RepID=A0A8J3CHH8_9PSEU|nr:hypothetical protein GCM10012275_36240 [Longimycelium tulufanense]
MLVNNAGGGGPTAPLEEISPDEWRDTVASNLESQFLCIRRAIPMLRSAGGGSIINISSTVGRDGCPNRSPYTAAKAGVIGLTKTAAMELGPDNIRVNVVQPGPVEGPRGRWAMAARAKAFGETVEQAMEQVLQMVSLRRLVTADDIAAAVTFLAGPAAQNITGQTIAVDAGLHGMM